jgi:hypothetical protein
VKGPRITKPEATAIAKAECGAHDWPWIEPVTVNVDVSLPPSECGWRYWTVKTNADKHGATARILFDVSFDGRHVMSHWIGPPWPRD